MQPILEAVRTLLPLNKGWHMLDRIFEEAVTNREEVEQYWIDNPFSDTPIRKPVVIVGPYRTGTTYLHRQLSLELPHYRTLAGWESYIPVPPSDDSYVDPRGKIHDEIMNAHYKERPILQVLHDEPAYAPGECVRAMAMTGISGLFPALAYCPKYMDWLLDDATHFARQAYQFYDNCLRMMGPGEPWLLKAPMHSLFMGPITAIWPDVTFVRIERDLGVASESLVKYYSHLRELSTPGRLLQHQREVRAWALPYLERHAYAVDDYEASDQGHRVITIQNKALRTEPDKTLQWVINNIKER